MTRFSIKALIVLMALAVSAPVCAADIQPALTDTFRNEGAFQKIHGDSGNWTGGAVGKGENVGTAYGLAGAVYYKYFAARGKTMREVTLQDTIPVYEANYWRPLRLYDVRNQIIANQVFDSAVNMGTGTAARILQRAINYAGYPLPPIAVDGKIGAGTIKRLNQVDQTMLYVHLIGLTHNRYVQIVDANSRKMQFLDTWAYRVKNNVQRSVHEYEAMRAKR